jgi:branched-chain amino acid transport system substrate-binding protein
VDLRRDQRALRGDKQDRLNRPGKLREAILSTKGYKGAEGEYNFDEFGDGLHGYNIVRNEKGIIVFDKHIEFTD